MVGAEPSLEELPDGQERSGAADGSAFSPLGSKLLPARIGLIDVAVEDERALCRASRNRIDPTVTRISQTPGGRSRIVPFPHAIGEK